MSSYDYEPDSDVLIANQELRKMPSKHQKKPTQPAKVTLPVAPNPNFMVQAEVLAAVSMSRSSLYLYISRGEFPKPKKIGKRMARWSRQEVEAWITEKLA